MRIQHTIPCAYYLTLGLLCGLCLCRFCHAFVASSSSSSIPRRIPTPDQPSSSWTGDDDASLRSVVMAAAPTEKRQRPRRTPAINITRLGGMKRPFLDRVASTLFRLENDRVEQSSVLDGQGRKGEPMEWSESESFANKFSELVGGNPWGYRFKQWVADVVAGDDFDKEAVGTRIDAFVESHPVAMFSFTTCPFCRRAKDFFAQEGIEYRSLELDELEGNAGNEIRSILGKKTGRTSVPSIFIGGKYIGGCNDGPGLLPLAKSGELTQLLKAAGVSTP
jgi:glutaredoxin 3